MKTLLVTGKSGFVGTHLQQKLAENSCLQLIPADRFNLCDPSSLDNILPPAYPDAVIHLAGQTFIPEVLCDLSHTPKISRPL